MDCPVDGSNLEKRVLGRVKLDECHTCGGLWFGEDELHKAMDKADPDVRWLDFEFGTDQENPSAEWSSRRCPQCGRNLATVTYRTTGIKVDYCPEHHGIWLDKGEFQAIIEALDQEAAEKDVSDYVRASLKEALDIFAGDEGIISEWKDFLTVTRLLQYRVLAEKPQLANLLLALQRSNPLK